LGFLLFFFTIFGFLSKLYRKLGEKLGNNICPLFTMLMKQNLINILHSEFEKKSVYLACWVIQSYKEFVFLEENDFIIMGDLLILKLKN
jgi:hypothetical protein